MASTSVDQSWKEIAKRKCALRDSQIPSEWLVPQALLPRDPPLLSHGAQNVLSIPSACGVLSESEINITENYSVQSILHAISTNTLSSVDVTTAFCKRSAIAQQLTNCITEPLFASAIQRAHILDNYLAKHGQPIGPFHGLPISVKDSFDISGIDTSIGVASLCFKPAEQNSPLIDLLLSLGCIIIAKTNIPQTLNSLDSVNNVFGRTMNPINRLCTAGGSSGGEAVLVKMRGAMVGWGADTGGSIRVPAMCNGIFGIMMSSGRIPAGGKLIDIDGMARCGVLAVAGPFTRTIEDLDFVLREVVPRSWLFAEDCIDSPWLKEPKIKGSGGNGEFVFGVLRGDGNCVPLPPMLKLLDEVKSSLSKYPGVKVLELPSPPAWKTCQSLMAKLMAISGGDIMADMLETTGEPLMPWMQGKFKRAPPRHLNDVAELQGRRSQVEREMMKLWTRDGDNGGRKQAVDAVICLVAPHPVPEIERYNAAGYTSSWRLLDYPAATVPIRDFLESDLELGVPQRGEVISSWDERNRQLWNEKTVDRQVYLGTPMCVQVVTPRLQDQKLIEAMKIVVEANQRSMTAGMRQSNL